MLGQESLVVSMLVLASSQPPSLTDSCCPKRWCCPHSSLYRLCQLPVCTVSQLSYYIAKPHQTKENKISARLVSQIGLFLRASCKEDLGLRSAGQGMEKIPLPGGVDHLGQLSQSCAQSFPSWVSTKTQTQWNPSCGETTLISLCLSHLFFSVGSLRNILYFYANLLKETVKHKRTNRFRKQISFIPLLMKAFVL